MQRLMTKAQFAKAVGVTAQFVGRECNYGPLQGAMYAGRIDLDAPETAEWLGRRNRSVDDVALPAPKANRNGKPETKRARRSEPGPSQSNTLPDAQWVLANGHMRDIQNLTVQQVAENFGTSFQFQGWLDAMQKIVQIQHRKMLMDERRGTLVRRELVKQTVFSAMESYHRRLLSDLPRTIAARTYAAAASGVPKEESEALIKELISGGLQRVKEEALRLVGDKVEDEREIEG